MKNIALLPVDEEIKSKIRLLADKLSAIAGITTDILSVENKTVRVRIEQKELRNGFILNQAQLVVRGAIVLAPLENKYKIHYVPLTFSPDFGDINYQWINDRMHEFKVSRNDIIKQLAIDKSTLSLMLSGERPLTRFTRAAFWYYFLQFEINRDLREAFN